MKLRGTFDSDSHTQARYVLPPIINQFMRDYPEVSLQMQQGRLHKSRKWLPAVA